jgi:hypothetical protein
MMAMGGGLSGISTLPPQQGYRDRAPMSSSSHYAGDNFRVTQSMHQPRYSDRDPSGRRPEEYGAREVQLFKSRAEYMAVVGEDIFESKYPMNINQREISMGRQIYYYHRPPYDYNQDSALRQAHSSSSMAYADVNNDDDYRYGDDGRGSGSLGRRRRRDESDGGADYGYQDDRICDDRQYLDKDQAQNDGIERQRQRRRQHRSLSPSAHEQRRYQNSLDDDFRYRPSRSERSPSPHGGRDDRQQHQSIDLSALGPMSRYDHDNYREE